MSDPTTTSTFADPDNDDASLLRTVGSSEFRETASPALRTVVAAVRAAVIEDTPVSPATDLDWDLVLGIARRHQVVPLVYEGLSSGDVPASVIELLRDEVQRNAKRNLRLAGELVRILDAFDDANVRAIPYKGPVLASVAYGDIGRRMFQDIDLLVHPDDVLEAGRVLQSNGYCADEEFATFARLGRDAPLLASPVECAFRHEDDDTEVELRWDLGNWTNALGVQFEGLWRRREQVPLAGRDVPILSPVDRLVVLSAHGTRHAWQRLQWLADVPASLHAHSALDWSAVERRAQSWSVTVPLHIATTITASVFDAPLSDRAIDRALADRRAVTLAEYATSWVAETPLGSRSIFREFGYHLAATDSIWRTVPIAIRFVFQPEWIDYRTRPLPRPLWPTYLLLKPVRVAKYIAENEASKGRTVVGDRP